MRNKLLPIVFLVLAALAFAALVLIPPATRFTILDQAGEVVYDSEGAEHNHADRVEFQQALRGEPGVVIRRSETTGVDLLYGAKRIGDHVVRLAIPCEGIFGPLLLARFGFLLAGVLGALIAFVILRYGKKIDTAHANEEFRREFTANVTHELRTPLTAILGAVEMLGEGESLSAEERRELFAIVREQAGRLNLLAQDVLALAQLERAQQASAADFAPVEVDALLARVRDLESPKAKQLGVTLSSQGDAGLTLEADAALLEQALVNLVENALRYSGSDRIELEARRASGKGVDLIVRDHGIGIASHHLPRLFERFYRVDKARSRSLGGTGLGLAIVKHIAQLHRGTVQATSIPGEKTEFTIHLP